MRQDGAKMRKMEDVSSVLGPPRRHGGVQEANKGASRGPGRGRGGDKCPQDGPKRGQDEAIMDQDSSR